jgi:4-alpha-glucanotransferase
MVGGVPPDAAGTLMSEALDQLARAYGILLDYVSETGETRLISDETKRGLLAAMGVAAATDEDIASALRQAPPPAPASQPLARCYLPPWLEHEHVWGISCQLYSLRSARNLGIGDFADLAVLAEIAASAGADFIGLNPLHALFTADAGRFSPYSPSDRRMLNWAYIAIDRIAGSEAALAELKPEALASLRLPGIIDYAQVCALKLELLKRLFRSATQDLAELRQWRQNAGQVLQHFAVFEALSEWLVSQGHSAGWRGWPAAYQDPASATVADFAADHAEDVTFHCWLQWLAHEQLAAAQRHARAAGMRIGLYLDLAVGSAPDGAATWMDRELVVPGARIGSPPDPMNDRGQDWGLAPIAPATLVARNMAPLDEILAPLMAHTGAIRIDHVMALQRLFWIPSGLDARGGGYVGYPLDRMIEVLANASHRSRCMVIGEDLGTVPFGFRDAMREAAVQSYRVLWFERDGEHFLPPFRWPAEAMACISTHDLPTLAGWWAGSDIALRQELGKLPPEQIGPMQQARAQDRRLLLDSLAHHGGLTPGSYEVDPPGAIAPEVVTAAHRLLARTPSRLMVAQIEDLIGVAEQVNLPGTVYEHPNWRRKLPLTLQQIAEDPLFLGVTAALREERPRT